MNDNRLGSALFLLPVGQHVRFRKRILGLAGQGVETKVMAFEREHYSTDTLRYESLGRVEHGNYLKRIWPLVKAVARVRTRMRSTDVVYAFGLDMLLLGWVAAFLSRQQFTLVYEVGDIRSILIRPGVSGKLLRAIERFLLRRTKLLVVTSDAYLREYFGAIQGADRITSIVAENKLPIDYSEQPRPRENENGRIVIGYFGVLRCSRSWDILKSLPQFSRGRISVSVRGYPRAPASLVEDADAIPGIHYGGPYKSPSQLSDVYGEVDLVWAAHYHQKANLMWARANRFYEACYFNRPMIAQSGTEDGKIVQDLGIGLCIDLLDKSGAVRAILDISDNDIARWRSNLARVPEEVYCYTDEHERIAKYLFGDSPPALQRS